MSVTLPARMTAETYVAWAMEQPEGARYELVDGQVVAMAPERSAHSIAEVKIAAKLLNAIRDRGLACDVYSDSMAVRVADHTVYEPDVMVRCGKRLDGDAVLLLDPVIIVEVLSPSTLRRDTTIKFIECFAIPSMRHYVVVDAASRKVVHHRRDDAGEVRSRILGDAPLELDPPGIVVSDLLAMRD